VRGRTGKLVRGEALRMRHHAFSVRFKNIHSGCSYECIPDRLNAFVKRCNGVGLSGGCLAVTTTLCRLQLCTVLGPFSVSVFVALQIGARLNAAPLVTKAVFPRRSASETEALQTVLVASSRYQERHNCDAPQLAAHCRCFHERVQSRCSFERSTSEWSAVHSEDIYVCIMDHNLSFCDMLE
jgi:hypothetical protein